MKVWFSCAVVVLALQANYSIALAEKKLGPGGNPDIVLDCFADNKPSEGCRFGCGSELDTPNGGKRFWWTGVSKVEFYHRDKAGRTDTRTWVFIRHRVSAPPAPANETGLFIGPPIHCMHEQLVTGNPTPVLELRPTKFNF